MEQTKFLGAYDNFDAYAGDLFDKLLKATKAANGLPDADNFKYYSSYPPFKGTMNNVGQRLLDLTQKFLDFEKGEKAPLLNVYDDSEDVLEQFDSVIDVVDTLIEKVDSFADEARGDPHHKSSIVIAKTKTPSFSKNEETYLVFTGNNIPRPQIKFEDKIDNSNRPWAPLTKLTSKPNALKPLYKLEDYAEYEEDIEFSYPHPYENEITEFQYTEKQLVASKEISPGSLESTPFTWIDTVPQLEKLAALLEKEEEIAIDLESHSYRSFQGFTCLMQISTRKEDFVIDTLVLRNKMNILNTSFTNPKIVKVLHGADSDVVWLQRDFGLYLVNLFDTGQASRVLEFPKFSLAYLLSLYCNVLADKKYQLADWRIRPIPEEMLRYAREDTHYLLYIYDKLKNELIAHGNQNNNLLLSVLNRSRELCLKKYEKEKYLKDSYLVLYNKFNLTFNSIQMAVFAGLYKWRDTVAREQDESVRFVLPNHMLFKISEVLPSDPSALLQCCNPVPPLVKTYTMEILSIINEAKKEKLTASPIANPFASPAKDLSSTISTGISSGMYQSPVLTTDQLYTAAGWLEDNEFHWTPRSKYNIIMPSSNENFETNAPFVTTLFLNSFKEDEDDEEDEQQQIYRDKVAKIQSSITDSIINARAPPELFKSFNDQNKIEEKKAEVASKLEDVPEEEPLPQSMAEIYKLSNQIKRKRNKEKKKLKQEQVNQEDEHEEEEEEEEEDKSLRNKKLKGEGKVSDPVEFMKEIGWVDKQQQTQSSQQQQSGYRNNNQGNSNNNNNRNNNYQRKGNYQNFTPYDYSQNQQQQSQQQNLGTGGNRGGYFNPYANPALPVKQTNKKGFQNNNRGKAWKPNKQ